MDLEQGIFLQDFLDLVHVFQKDFLPNFEEIKAVLGYRSYRRYGKPDLGAYQRLVQAVINDECAPGGHEVSKAAIYYLERNLRYLDYLFPPEKMFVIRAPRYPNRIKLEGYSISTERRDKALMLLAELLSANEMLSLKYDCELIRRNYFAIFRTK